MSKAAKQIMMILIVLLVGCLAFAGYSLLEKQRIEKLKIAVDKELEAAQTREMTYLKDNKALQEQAKSAEEEKAKIQVELTGVNEKLADFNAEMETLTKDRDDWKGRVETLQKERQELVTKLQQKAEPQVVYKYIEKEAEEKPPEAGATPTVSLEGLDDSYWAKVLKEKAELEVKMNNLSNELTTTVVKLQEMQKENSDLQLEIGHLKTEHDSIERQIKEGKDLSDTLSLELARAKGDKKFMNDQVDKIKQENNDLRSQIKDLSSAKVALEKSIVSLTDEKKGVEKKLYETENVIQSKIEEIWQMKQGLTKSLDKSSAQTQEIELPPIIVNASGGQTQAQADAKSKEPKGITDEDFKSINGNIVSINSENNFVIVDLGEKDGIKIGDKFGVYRNSDFVAEVEVIQVRADISAADIKQMKSSIKVGDIIR
ncbi:MAG: hypothetical protein A2Z88_01255 [Omnitrophica WOR_2 bacterium GWA2_47_8]|nr:MAG: hypothetical protein A2Z88_01255 [Omnitrophica WOR_2 bacterium GWA2_47_8]